ncbi:MAG: cache domain-containing protein [Cellvibrionaceae bacterium]
MNLSQKIQLLSILPLMVAMLIVALVTETQFEKLSAQTASTFRDSITNSRKQELKNYISLALSSINHIYGENNQNDSAAQELVIDILSNLEYGEDGYFFAYSNQGENIVHPKQAYRIGRNWWDLQDEEGQFIIRDLISNAQEGGGFVEYLWEKPSKQEVAKKLAYSVMLDRWDWMLGTGIYIDDIDRDVAIIQGEIDKKIENSSYVILMIALAAFAIVFSSGIFLQFSERKLADEKLQELTKRILNTQDEERRRVSRELHDGISQLIASAKFSLETAAIKIKENKNPDEEIKTTQDRIGQTLQDLRRISRDLHPSILDDHGLSVGIKAMAKNFTERTGTKVTFSDIFVRNILPLDVKTALYRVAQEALTNIERHADASLVEISIRVAGAWITLSIQDNGKGFDVASLERSKSPTEGIGLRNMHERLAYHKGIFSISSNSKGTLIEAKIPKTVLRYDANKFSESEI